MLDLKEQICSYFKTWRIEAPSGNTSAHHTVVGCGLCGVALLLFPTTAGRDFGWAWNWVCGSNWELQDSDFPIFSSLDPAFQVPSSQVLLVPVIRDALLRWRCLLFSVYFCQLLTRFA